MAQTVHLSGMASQTQLAPGARQRLDLVVSNHGDMVDLVTVSVSGLPDDWFMLSPAAVSLFPGASATIVLMLHPPSNPVASAGTYPFSVEVASSVDASARESYGSNVVVTSVGRLGMTIDPIQADGRDATFHITWQNLGNGPRQVVTVVEDAEAALRITCEPDGDTTVPAGGEATVAVTVAPISRETVGEPHPYQLTFRGMNPGTKTMAEPGLMRMARYTYVPPVRALALPAWLRRLPFWALLALMLLVLLLLFLAGNRAGQIVARADPAKHTATPIAPSPSATPSPTPSPTATATATPTAKPLPAVGSFGLQVAPSGGVKLVWSVKQADVVTLNGKKVDPSGSLPLSVKHAMSMMLAATNSTGTVSQTIDVVPPPTKRTSIVHAPERISAPAIKTFTAAPDSRTGTIRITWNVLGALRTTLNGKRVAAAGAQTIASGAGTKYVLEAGNGAGSSSAALLLPGQAPPAARTVVVRLPSIQRFAVTHARAGAPYVLLWRTRDAGTVTLNGSAVAVNGSKPLPVPIQSGRYDLVARTGAGQVSATVQVSVQ